MRVCFQRRGPPEGGKRGLGETAGVEKIGIRFWLGDVCHHRGCFMNISQLTLDGTVGAIQVRLTAFPLGNVWQIWDIFWQAGPFSSILAARLGFEVRDISVSWVKQFPGEGRVNAYKWH